jgi:hypothetical protein
MIHNNKVYATVINKKGDIPCVKCDLYEPNRKEVSVCQAVNKGSEVSPCCTMSDLIGRVPFRIVFKSMEKKEN